MNPSTSTLTPHLARSADLLSALTDVLVELQDSHLLRFDVLSEALSEPTRAKFDQLIVEWKAYPERFQGWPGPIKEFLGFLATNVRLSPPATRGAITTDKGMMRGGITSDKVLMQGGALVSDKVVGVRIRTRESGSAVHSAEPVINLSMEILSRDAARAGAIEFMGGKRIFKSLPQSRADIHGTIVRGLPYESLVRIVDSVMALTPGQVTEVVGISERTLRRQKEDPKKKMPPDLASKTWMFAETLATASAVFGGREAAERWMSKPAMGLDGARPIDLLRTLQGAELVNEFLGRLEHGVYN
jgi:putative toxin-antitoxin system antitoxin component (TIGR02293 family)